MDPGGPPYEKVRDAHGKICIKPLMVTNLCVAGAFFDSLKIQLNTKYTLLLAFEGILKEILTAKIVVFTQEHP